MQLTIHRQLASCSRPAISTTVYCPVRVGHFAARPTRSLSMVKAVQHVGDDQEASDKAAPQGPLSDQPEVMYTEQQLTQETPDLPDPTGSDQQEAGDHHLDKIVYKTAHEAPGSEGQSGRFDEEPIMPDQPYSPKPSERGHGVPPHKDESNTRAPDRNM